MLGIKMQTYPLSESEVAILLNVVFVVVPIALIVARQTMMIRASITAYSTAVGPSSETKKFLTLVAKRFIEILQI